MTVTYQYEQETLSIEVPFNAEEFQFEAVADFMNAEQKFLKEAQADLPDDIDEDEEYDEEEIEAMTEYKIDEEEAQLHLIDAVSEIIPDIDLLPFSIEGDDPNALINEKYFLKPGHKLSTVRLYAHIITIINSYKPEELDIDYKVEWNNETYYLEPDDALRVLGFKKAYTNADVIIVNRFNQKANKKSLIQDNLGGNIMFNLGIEEMAILLRKKNEEVPLKRSRQIAWINERKKIFKKMPYSLILNVRFFLLSIIDVYLNQRSTSISSMASQ